MKLLKTICVAALLLAQSSISLAQDNRISRGTWDDVKAIPIGEKLEVRLQTGKTEKGTLSAVSDTGLNISLDRATINVNRDNVRQLHRVVRGASKKSAIVGAVAPGRQQSPRALGPLWPPVTRDGTTATA